MTTRGFLMRVLGAVLIGCLLSVSSGVATAAPQVQSVAFANCKAMNEVYVGGVAKAKNWKNKGGKLKNAPVVNAKVYAANKGKDRDKDGLVCEN
jgi:hypothetical protein